MAQEERSHSGGSGGGCRPKKTKQKKAPQRGLGVAQLEKIISEEKQQKGYLGKIADSDTTFLALHNNSFRPISLCPENEIWSKSWNGEYNNNNHSNNNNNNNFGSMSHNFIAFEPQNGPILAHRSHQFQRPSPLIKHSSAISTVMSNQMEPPSIPSVHFKNYALTEEDKMIGIMKKRPYPFSLDHSHPKSDEQQQYTLHMEPRNKLIRESVSTPGRVETNLNKVPSNSERLNGNFLTLAPPAVASPPSKLHHKHTLDFLSRSELSDSQGYDNESQIHRAGPSGLVRNSFNFFPIEVRTNQNTAYVRSGDGEKGETIDLNLKL
ncbi:hypothetical protein CASFOL_019197 [Castilleja foliolosa]|uniref:Uncharacterized protein n=1 Tax=Castilleja foliolosa TaxID=1961234 RepID=A0ABD3D3P9_9LAMI